MASPAQGYDEPAFSKAPFDADGIFLSQAERQIALEAMASIACNFQGSHHVDSDLIEKSLAIALSLAPFHKHARQAHEALVDGRAPETTTFFDSRSAISEALWRLASDMTSPPAEPEELKLAPLLMEISLLTHPEPTTERLLFYKTFSGGKRNPWAGFVSLQPDLYDSNKRLENLKREAKNVKRNAPALSGAASEPDSATMPETETPANPKPDIKLSKIREEIRNLTGVFPNADYFPAGTFTLHVRAPTGPVENSRFPFLTERTVKNYPILPLLPAPDNSPTLIGINFPMEKALSYGATWQQGAIGEVSFKPILPLLEEERASKVRSALQVTLSLKSITNATPFNPSIGVLGAYELASESVRPVEDPAALLRAAKSLDLPYLLIPANALTPLLETLSSSEELELLFFSELLSYNTLDEAYRVITLPEISPAMHEASLIFAEIEAVSVRMPLPELARNIKVQERLESILKLVPHHFSALAMHKFGQSPSPGTSEALSDIERIDELILPYLALRDEQSTDENALRNALDNTDIELARIRADLQDETRGYHTMAADLLEAAEIYLGLTNTTSAIAEQRLREFLVIADDLNREREQLGLPALSAED